METYLTQITDYLVRQSWQIAVLVVVIAAANFALRNKSAHVRYLLWLIVLAKCLTPPLLEIPVAVLPEKAPAAMVLPTPMPTITEAPAEIPRPAKPAPIVAPVSVLRPQLSTRQWLAIGWLVGAAAFACIAAVKACRTVRWLHRDRRPLPQDVQAGVNDLLSSLNLRRLPKMWLIEGIGQPFVWGALRGDIYLPASFVRIADDERRKHVLVHELSHVMRFDAAINLVQTIAQAMLWFHPFVWWANKKIRAEREKCCDEMAIARLGTRAKDYSRAIVETLVTEYESTRPVPSLAIAGPVRNIEERIRTMLRPGKKFYKRPSLPVAAIVILTALLAVPSTVVLTVRAQERSETESEDAGQIFSNPTNLGPSVNSFAREYDPSISADGLELYFNSYRPGSIGQSDIWVATRKAKTDPWEKPINLGPRVNSPAREIAPDISADGLSLYFSSGRSGGYGNLDIWATTRRSKTAPWTEPVNLGPTVNSTADEHAPSISTDGLELYFSGIWEDPKSLRSGGLGGADIWMTTRETRSDPWGTPVNLGSTINSSTYDESPSISYDGLSLYFQSHRPGGYGGSDVWVAKRKSTSDAWSIPVNLGSTVNSAKLEINPDISGDGTTLYFISGRPGGVVGDTERDIWQATLKQNPENRLTETSKLKPSKSLHQAAADGDLEQVKLHISNGADVNAKDRRGRAALHRAAYPGHLEIVRLLIEHGADVNVEDKLKRTPLEHAAVASRKEVVKLLIEKGANPNARNKNGLTPLHVAAGSADKDTVEVLIDKGASVTLRDTGGGTPLYTAMMSAYPGRRDIVDLIVATGKELRTIHLAAYVGDLVKVKTFIEEGVAIDEKETGGGTALHCAAAGGRKQVAELLLAHSADVNARATDGMTPLHSAVFCSDDAETVKLLIANGADINTNASVEGEAGMSVLGLRFARCIMQSLELADREGKNDDLMTARVRELWDSEITQLLISQGARLGDGDSMWLSVAASMDIPDIMELAITQSDDVNAKQLDGSTFLHGAAHSGQKELVEQLIAKGADVNAKDKEGQIPLHLAAFRNHPGIVGVLIANGADIEAEDKGENTPLRGAAVRGNKEVVALLLDKGADIDNKNPLTLIAAYGTTIHFDVIRLLIDRGADIESRGSADCTPLQTVAEVGRKEVAELLVAHAAKVNAAPSKFFGTTYHQAMRGGHPEMVRWCLSKGMHVPPLHQAAYFGETEKVRSLLNKGADVNKEDIAGFTALHCAVFGRNKEIVQLLIDKGANVRANNAGHATLLCWACEIGDLDIVKLLVDNGAQVNGPAFGGLMWGPMAMENWSNLHTAAHMGHANVVEYLLDKGADINAKCTRGDGDLTPLHFAARKGHGDVVKALLTRGANANLKSKEGHTAMDLAEQENHKEIVELLRKHGAKE